MQEWNDAGREIESEHLKKVLGGHTPEEWAEVIAERISDKSPYDAADKKTLKMALTRALAKEPLAIIWLMGTGIIEADYFEEIGGSHEGDQRDHR